MKVWHTWQTPPKLQTLILNSAYLLTDAFMEPIGQLTELTKLRFNSCKQLTDKGMVYLQHLKKWI